VLVPLKAALGFLLSVLAALGAVVAVFQRGWPAALLGRAAWWLPRGLDRVLPNVDVEGEQPRKVVVGRPQAADEEEREPAVL
jgi:RND superfamily putative drug exporter